MKIRFGKSGNMKVCVEQNRHDSNRIWLFDPDFTSYTVYVADKLIVDENRISLEAEKFFRVSFWEDMFDEPDERAKELFESFPEDLPELKISVKSKDNRTWV